MCDAVPVRIISGCEKASSHRGRQHAKYTTNHPTTIKTVPGEFGALLYLAVPCFVLAVIFHPGAFPFCCLRPKAHPSHMCHPCQSTRPLTPTTPPDHHPALLRSALSIITHTQPLLLTTNPPPPGLNSHFLADTTWAFSMYLESVAMLPQLYMFQKQVGWGLVR